ncbi:DNA polymerase [Pseudonocardia sp. McavD-2-B]|uniref:DNA polymerase n=1 Tax=Pseudonocardia sp. McavD-2-B TaxID=2954499 RepID=UPI0020983789|nr:DNA polymerase [Pseudonocardia sp. McavD-2-B]MCO7195042.1 DNA polymerase [Pseudonocardia sp. McavD-2-B]
MTQAPHLTDTQREALDVARGLARAGVPVFVARPDETSATGFALPTGWQHTAPDPAVVDAWSPGMALCAVMGAALDLLDVDPRNGGDLEGLDVVPVSYGTAETPSGGFHSFIAPLGVGSRDGVLPGVDVKGGLPDGSSRGFAFLAPTVKASKATGEPVAYTWHTRPDLDRLTAAGRDRSGAALADRVRAARSGTSVTRAGGPAWWREFATNREPQAQVAAERAIAEKLAAVADWNPADGDGFRSTLMRAAMTLGGYVGGGWLDESDAWSRLERACSQAWGAPDEDDRRWIEQGLTDGAEQPFRVYTPEDEARFGDAAQAVAAQRPAGPPWSPYRALGVEAFDPYWCGNDQEFAEAVAARTVPVLRYASDADSWVVRQAEAWREREDLSGWAVSIVARLMPLGETPIDKDPSQRTDGQWQAVRRASFMNSGTSSRVERKLRTIVKGGDHPAAVELAGLDADPEVLWAGGVPWDLRASLDEPIPAAVDPSTPHLHTAKLAPALVDTPVWDRFVAAVWPDPDVRRWALRVLSLALAGYPDAALPVLYGPERTGKTALVTLLVDVLGSYGHAADPRLLGSGDGTHASVVYALRGRRLSFIDEGPRRGHLAAERLKQLTGGGQLTGNAMRANPVTFTPTHTLVMTTNDEPPITDPALRARMRIVPCEADQATVRAARQALTPAVWAAEAPGVLAALMSECAAWLAEPDTAGHAAAPASLVALADDMAAGQDPVREWREMCTLPSDPGTPGRELYRSFVGWFDAQPIYRRQSPPSETAFGRSLTEQGFPFVMGGPRKNVKYRPLSVMDPGTGLMPGAGPTPPGTVAPVTPGPDSSPTVADGSSAELSDADNTRSEPKFSSAADSSDSSPRTISSHNHDYSNRSTPDAFTGGIGDDPLNCRTEGGPDGPGAGRSPRSERPSDGSDSAAPDSRETNGARARNVSDQARSETSPRQNANVGDQTAPDLRECPEWLRGRDLSLSVTKEEAAARAGQDGTSRSEARKALNVELRAARSEAKAAAKIAEREAAVAAAAGEVLALPAVVDRAGNVLPVTLDQAEAVVRAALARTDGTLTVDVETSGYPVGHTLYALRTVQLGDDVAAAVLHPVEHAGTVRELLAAAGKLHAHSATADLVPLDVAGLIDRATAWDRMHDTVIPAKLADPQSTGSDPGLKRLAGNVLGAHAVIPAAEQARGELWKAGRWSSPKMFADQLAAPIERNGWANVESGSTTMLRYAASDVLDTAALGRTLPQPPEHVLDRERLAQRVMARVAHDGVRIDGAHVAALTETHTAGKAEAGERVRAFGVENPGSDAQVGALAEQLGAALPRTDTGKPSVKAGVLEPLRKAGGRLGEFVSAVLDYRHHDTALGLFLRPYALLGEHGDGRARPTVYTIGTDTGRMSCVRPNLQQLPREGGVRACITADPGELLVSADFSGVELRVAAALSQDPTLLALIAEEDAFNAEISARAAADGTGDKAARTAILAERGWRHAGRADGLHWVVARIVWGEDATKAHRYIAKRIVFGRLYGGGLATLAEQGGTDQATAQRAIDALDEITPRLSEWSRQVREAVKAGNTQFATYSGRVIHLPQAYPHKAPNYCIQGTARELLVDAVERWERTRWAGSRVLPVHDEIVTFVPEAEAADATAALMECMTAELFGVRIVAEADEPSFAWQDSA